MTATPVLPDRGTRSTSSSWMRVVRASIRQSPWLVLTGVVTLLVALPLIPLQWRAFADGGAGLREMVGSRDVESVFWMTARLGVGAMVVGLVLGTVLALCVYNLPSNLQKYTVAVPVLPLIIPSVAHVVGFVFLFSPESGYVNVFLRSTPLFDDSFTGPINVYSPFWIIAYSGLHLSSIVYLFVFNGLQNLGPDYGLAARANGAGPLRILRTITIPLLRPVLLFSAVVGLLMALGQFTAPLLLGRREGLDVVTTRMYFVTQEYPVNYAVASAFGAPLLLFAIILFIVQRRMLGNQSRFVGKGAGSAEVGRPSRRVTSLSLGFIVVFAFLSAVLPLLALVFVAFSRFWSGQIDLGNFTTDHVTSTLSDPNTLSAIQNSLQITGLAILCVIPLSFLIAYGLYERDKLWRPLVVVLDTVANLPLAVPAALFGFGFLFAYSSVGLGLYGSTVGLVIAYVTIMVPFAVRSQLATLIALGRDTTEASRASGATLLRTFVSIIFPLARGSIASSAALIFVLLIHEFGVSVLLRSPDTSVMSVVLFDKYGSGSYPQVAVVAIIMTVVTALGVFVALLFGGRRALERL